jgi:hypothetical protein
MMASTLIVAGLKHGIYSISDIGDGARLLRDVVGDGICVQGG